MTTPDRIEKQVVLKAAPERVWQAISNSKEFGEWFGLDTFGRPFEAGRSVTAKITSPGEYEGTEFPIWVVSVEPPGLFSFRWHPYAVDKEANYESEPTTLVEFTIEPAGTGTKLTVTESGFDAIPEDRRDTAFRSNDEGWGIQVMQIRDHVDA